MPKSDDRASDLSGIGVADAADISTGPSISRPFFRGTVT